MNNATGTTYCPHGGVDIGAAGQPSYQPQYCNASDTVPGLPYCPTSQPTWSAYRESSFGHGLLKIKDSVSATWEWHRNQVRGWLIK